MPPDMCCPWQLPDVTIRVTGPRHNASLVNKTRFSKILSNKSQSCNVFPCCFHVLSFSLSIKAYQNKIDKLLCEQFFLAHLESRTHMLYTFYLYLNISAIGHFCAYIIQVNDVTSVLKFIQSTCICIQAFVYIILRR